MQLKLFVLAFVAGGTLAGRCQAQVVSGGCELLVITSQHQILELHKPDYTLTSTKTGWDLKILNPETQKVISSLENPEISFCAGPSEVLARGVDVLASAVPVGATAFYATQHGKIYRFAGGVISLRRVDKVVGK